MESSETFSNNDSSSNNVRVINLLVPGKAEPYKITVSENDSVLDLKNIVIQSLEPSLRTCFSLTLDKKVALDDLAIVSNIASIKDGDVIRIRDEPYNLREAIFHITRLKETLNFGDKVNYFNKTNGLPVTLVERLSVEKDIQEVKNDVHAALTLKSNALTELIGNLDDDKKSIHCLKSIELSPYNPPVSQRKLLGDLLYLNVKTLEGKELCITCTFNGFYINKSTNSTFDPTPQHENYKAYTLSSLLSLLSQQYKTNLLLLIKTIEKTDMLEYMTEPKFRNNWVSKPQLLENNMLKAYESVFNVVGIEDVVYGQIRDWNEELQTIKNFDNSDTAKRIVRDRALNRLLTEKSNSSRRGAISILEGSIKSMNLTEPFRSKLFLWNNLFYSISCDVKGFYKELGGDDATHIAASLDNKAIEYLWKFGYEDISFIGSTILDYHGYRIISQTIAPGIFYRDQNDIIEHGMMMDNKSVKYSEKFAKLVQQLGEDSRIRPTKIIDCNGDEQNFYSSVELKGILGTDGRTYLVDLYRMLPCDPLFVDEEMNLSEFLPKDFIFSQTVAKNLFGYEFSAVRFKNKMRMFRLEFLNEFYFQRKFAYKNEVRTEYFKRSNERCDFDEITSNCLLEEIKRDLNNKYASSLELAYEYYVSPDCFITHLLNMSDEEEKHMEKDRAFCHIMSTYMVEKHVPAVVKKMSQEYIIDGESLRDYMHLLGINMRYLGYIMTVAARLHIYHIEKIALSEMIIRVVKKMFRRYLAQNKLSVSTPYLISHILNCFLGVHDPPKSYNYHEFLMAKKGKKKNKESGAPWKVLTCKGFWDYIKSDMSDVYNIQIDCKNMHEASSKYGITPLSMLRRIALIMGLQLLLKNYDFTNTKHCTFLPEDIFNIVPVIKPIKISSLDVDRILLYSKDLVNYSYVEALKSFEIAASYVTQVYGFNNPQLAECYHLMATCYYSLEKIKQAVEIQKKSVSIYECYYGLEHYKTTKAYLYLGLFFYYDKEYVAALQILNRVIYLIKLCYGSDYPELINYYTNQAVILTNFGNNELNMMLLETSLTIAEKHDIKEKAALIKYYMCKQLAINTDFKASINLAKESLKFYEKLYGASDKFVQEIKQVLNKVTKMAVAKEQMINKNNKMDVNAHQSEFKLGIQDFHHLMYVSPTKKDDHTSKTQAVGGDIALD